MSEPTVFSLNNIFSDARHRYVIPLYQRNYAWGLAEIDALIDDIGNHDGGSYYIGTLIVKKRDNGEYEVIDGQQRLTTLSLICFCLDEKNEGAAKSYRNVLRFEAREQSNTLLDQIFNGSVGFDNKDLDSNSVRILENYKIIKNKIGKLGSEKLKNINIFRIDVPPKTDLNHYFEVMNNRGVQLEQHEILKAKLMVPLKEDADRSKFSSIWEACADMNRPIQMCFDVNFRDLIFTQSHDQFDGGKNHEYIYGADVVQISHSSTKEQDEQKRNSVIDFSNFLVQVIVLFIEKNKNQKIFPIQEKKYFNDKDFLKKYELIKDSCAVNIKEFSLFLLKSRFLLDSFIIHRSEKDNDFSIKIHKKDKESSYLKNSFSDKKASDHIIMLQSMFHVSHPSNTYKYWLYYAIKWLHNDYKSDETLSYVISPDKFIGELKRIGKEFFMQILVNGNISLSDQQCDPNVDDWKKINQGTGVHNFVFNWLDYLIWADINSGQADIGVYAKSYGEKIGSTFPIYDEGKGQSVIFERIKYFNFTQRSSVEHFYAQNMLKTAENSDQKWSSENIHNFGNLCLISKSENSRFSDQTPVSKRDEFVEKKKRSAESLKLMLMMLHKNWDVENMECHEKLMIELLKSSLSSTI